MAEQTYDSMGRKATTASPLTMTLDANSRLVLNYFNELGQRVTLDLTAEIERIADEKVKAHLHALHGHQI